MLFRTSIALFTLLVAGTSAQDCTADGLCDKHERCGVWKEEGECYLNKKYMLEECPASCSDEDYPTKTDKACKDHHLRCPVWADLGECAENPTNMKRYCPLSCGICKDPNRDTNDDGDDHLCVDSDAQCEFWVSRGECSANPGFMHTACAKSCGTCVINKRKEEKKKKKAVDAAAAAEVNLTDEEQKLVTLSADFGDIQKITGAEAYNTLALLRQTAAYMQTDVPRLPDDIQDKW